MLRQATLTVVDVMIALWVRRTGRTGFQRSSPGGVVPCSALRALLGPSGEARRRRSYSGTGKIVKCHLSRCRCRAADDGAEDLGRVGAEVGRPVWCGGGEVHRVA